MIAIETRGAILSILHPNDFQQVFSQEFRNRADALQAHYQEMLSGLITAKIPTPSEVLRIDPNPGEPPAVIKIWGGTFGVVDIYSGTALLDRYPAETISFNPFELGDPPPSFLETYPALKAVLTLGALARKKAMYIAHGLHHAWEVIQKLRQLAGRTDIEKVDKEAVWSFREIDAIVGSLFDDPSGPPSFVRITAGVLIFKLSRLANLPTPKGLSFRTALDRATL
jgi:hypothetical protein